MSSGDQTLNVALPATEAADLTIKAAQAGVETAQYLGIHVLRSAYGSLHPTVAAFEKQASAGKVGTEWPEDGE